PAGATRYAIELDASNLVGSCCSTNFKTHLQMAVARMWKNVIASASSMLIEAASRSSDSFNATTNRSQSVRLPLKQSIKSFNAVFSKCSLPTRVVNKSNQGLLFLTCNASRHWIAVYSDWLVSGSSDARPSHKSKFTTSKGPISRALFHA